MDPAAPAAVAMPQTTLWPISRLIPVEYNPRTTEAAGLGESIAGFGLVQPLVVNEFPGREGRIIGGERRYHELVARGVEEVSVIVVSLPLERERELNIRLNRNQAAWDWEKLEAEFGKAELLGWGFESWEFGDIAPASDVETNHGGEPAHDTGAYLASTIKKFEILVPADLYDRVSAAIEAGKAEHGASTNSELFLALLQPYMPAAELEAGDDDGNPRDPAADD